MGVARQDHVDAFDNTGHFLVHVEPVVGQAHDQFGALAADLINHGLHMFIANTKAVFREHPAGVGDWHIGERLSDHRDLDATTFKEFVGREQFGRFIPFRVENVLTKGRERQTFDDFVHAVRP